MIPKRILFCTDFSENSEPAREYAISFAEAFLADLTIIHVVNAAQFGYPSLGDKVPVDLKSTIDGIRHSVDKGLEIIAEECRKRVRSVDVVSSIGNPASTIVRFAEEHAIELIVTGTHGWTGFKHLILGSTAENIVRHASCPVLTVRSNSGSSKKSPAE